MSFGRDLGRRSPRHPFRGITEPQMGQERLNNINRNQQGGPLGRDQRLFLADLMNPNNMIRKVAMQ